MKIQLSATGGGGGCLAVPRELTFKVGGGDLESIFADFLVNVKNYIDEDEYDICDNGNDIG